MSVDVSLGRIKGKGKIHILGLGCADAYKCTDANSGFIAEVHDDHLFILNNHNIEAPEHHLCQKCSEKLLNEWDGFET